MNRINGIWHLMGWKLLENMSCFGGIGAEKSLIAVGLAHYMGGKNLALPSTDKSFEE